MAFFSAVSSSIGKKLLLFGLRHIDILDKDPADFVSVDVGKKTTLEVRDVGLHVKKLVALLHLKLPPEIHLSKAKASLLRVTFILDFGVPQIIIELDGLQIHTRLLKDTSTADAKPRDDVPNSPEPRKVHRSTTRRESSSPPNPFAEGSSDASSDSADEHVPTVDDLAKSFIKEEPAEEIRELEEALTAQSEYLQESVASSDDGDDEGDAGVGAPLGLPTMLRNILNTALDRLQIIANHIDIEAEVQLPSDANTSNENEEASVTLNFHVDRIAFDSVTSQDLRVDIGSVAPKEDSPSQLGKRQMRIESIYARLISDAENFAVMSRASRPASPADTRSEVSASQKASSDAAASQVSSAPSFPRHQEDDITTSQELERPRSHSSSHSLYGMHEERSSSPAEAKRNVKHISSSVITTDEDRFADASSEEGMDQSIMSNTSTRSGHSLIPPEMDASSMLYDDEGLLEYAIQNDLFSSRLEESDVITKETTDRALVLGESAEKALGASDYLPDSSNSVASDLSKRSGSLHLHRPVSHSSKPDPLAHSDKFIDVDRQFSQEHDALAASTPSPPPSAEDDLAQSKLFTHDDAESMYMSAMSAAASDSSHHPAIPGGWDSASTSSQGTASDHSAPIPAAMVAGSVLGHPLDVDDGCETPRPGSRQSFVSSPPQTKRNLSEDHTTSSGMGDENPVSSPKLAKTFLTVDLVTIWFPLGLSEDQATNVEPNSSELFFEPPNLGQDSIFQEMPGSFSNYAHSSSSRRKGSISVAEPPKRNPSNKSPQAETPKPEFNRKPSPTINVEVGSVAAHIDLSTGRLMYHLLDRFLKVLTSPPESDPKSSKTQDLAQDPAHNPTQGPNSQASLSLSVRNVGIAWLERLMTESITQARTPRSTLELNPLDALLRIHLSTVQVASQHSVEGARSKFTIGKFILSSLDQDVLYFHTPKMRSRRSVSGLTEHLRNDIELDFEQTKDRRVTIVTRPVKVNFDMQKLDEALSSFGGFSGVLELGNSISSNNTAQSPTASTLPSRPRGVHFGDTPPTPTPAAANSSNMPKIQIQFGEVSFTLKGKSCALQLQTTSVRIAVRENNFRLKVSEVQLSGPYLDASQVGAPLLVEVKGSTVNFLFAPEEADLTRLISMITPSKDPYENDEDILIDTLLRQRRKGSVLRAEVAGVGIRLSDIGQMQVFEALGAEVARLSKVTKYLPDDDRPGILTLASVQQIDASIMVNERLGDVSLSLEDASLAHVGVPSLIALEVGKVLVSRGEEELVHEVVQLRSQDRLPMVMVRIVGDEMEPVIKAKLFNLCVEYHVSTIMAALGISDDGTADDIALGLASSVATITGGPSPKILSRQTSESSTPTTTTAKPLHIDLLLRSCAVGLNPRKIPSKGLFVLTDAHFLGKQATKHDYSVTVELRKASIHAIDDINRVSMSEVRPMPSVGSSVGQRQLLELRDYGFVSLSSISAAKVLVNLEGNGVEQPQIVNVEFKNELFVLESCADSTQTLIAILNGLQPPTPPNTAQKYRTVVPLQEMMESFTGDAFTTEAGIAEENFMDNADLVVDEVPTNLEFVGSFYNPDSLPTEEDMGDDMLDEDDLGVLATPPITRQRGDRGLLESFQEQYEVADDEQNFDFNDNYFKEAESDQKGTARKWDSKKNRYHLTNEFKTPNAPLKICVRDMNVIWNLFDGYDWPRTRGIITQAVEDVEARAEERRQRPRDDDEDEDFVEQDFLFNSVWIGVPVKDERGALARQINHDIDDLVSETGSYATSTATRSTGATARPRSSHKPHRRKLKLERSKYKKIAFQLSGVAADLIVFPPNSGETQNSLNVRVRDFEIYDHVPSSTWKKFVTSLVEPSQREMERPMINLELLTVKPITDLAASELVIRVTVLPLRLHVDQDALDFITRFFEFKDDTVDEPSTSSEQPFIQRLEVMTVTLKLDYKPKRVDYRGLRSGHTTEFMNFLILDGADIILRHAIVYGITSFDKLNKTLNDVWMPDVRNNQLPFVLSGLAAVRPIVNVGSGVRDLVVVPMREYRKDGRIVRSLQKGVYAFAKNTTSEVARLGAKVAIGTQNILEGAENFLNPQSSSPRSPSTLHDWDDLDPSSDSEEPRAVSNYANQPIGVKAGLRNAARLLERDLLTARDAIIAIPAEVMEEGTGAGMARAIARRAPTVILRPALGATKAVSNTLLGVGNALDKDSRRKIEDKYKSY